MQHIPLDACFQYQRIVTANKLRIKSSKGAHLQTCASILLTQHAISLNERFVVARGTDDLQLHHEVLFTISSVVSELAVKHDAMALLAQLTSCH